MQSTLKLILNDKEFNILPDIRYFNEINPEVRNILLSNHQYFVKSKVQDETFKSFIKFWSDKEIPNFTSSNISEYDQLSQEFGLMEEVISVYKSMFSQIQLQQSENKKLNLQIVEKTQKYHQIADILLKSDLFRKYNLKNEIYQALENQDAELIELFTRKIIQFNELLYILNEDDKTAEIFKCSNPTDHIKVPSLVNLSLQTFKVTKIHENAFKECPRLGKISFSKDISLFEIQKRAFYHSSLVEIVIPKSVTKICDEAFMNISNLTKVIFEPNSQLKSIGKSCFSYSGVSILILPSNFIEFGEKWCEMTYKLHYLGVSPSEQNNICLYNDDFLLSKSDPKSDTFDVLLLARRNIKRAVIPPFIREIAQYAFNTCADLVEVECSPDSQLKIIGERAFCSTDVATLTIPSSVEFFGKDWCNEMYELSRVFVIKQQIENIIFYENNFILGKSDLKSDNFDILYFAQRGIKNATIPSFIKIIASSAFDGCYNIEQVDFPSDTQIVSIERFAFGHSELNRIQIPYQITKIKKGTFQECNNLKVIDIPQNSKLQKFGKDSLFDSTVESLYIPEFVDEFKDNWCDMALNLTNITISPKNKNFIYLDDKFIIGKSDSSSSVYDVLVFARRDIKTPIIPSFIKRIATSAFNSCYNLHTVLFSSDSQLEIIDDFAFAFSSLRRIKIPSSVKQINNNAFDQCEKMEVFEFEENSKLESLKISAFHNTKVPSFIFPAHLVKIEAESLDFLTPKIMEFPEDMELKLFPSSILGAYRPPIIMIPVAIKKDFVFY